MAKGETAYNSEARKVSKFDNTPVQPNDYDFKLRTGKCAVAVADGVGKVPYVGGVEFELLNTKKEGGKNRIMYHSFFLRVDPAADGVAAVDRQDGVTAFCKATGLKLKNVDIIKAPRADEDGDMHEALILDPQKVASWLKANDGATGSLHTKIETWQDKKRGKVDYFIEADADTGEDEEAEEPEAEEEADEPEPSAPRPSKVKPLGSKKR